MGASLDAQGEREIPKGVRHPVSWCRWMPFCHLLRCLGRGRGQSLSSSFSPSSSWGAVLSSVVVPSQNECFTIPKKETTPTKASSKIPQNHQQPANRPREREKKQNPLNRAAESAASRILMDVVVLLHLQCFFSTCKFPICGSRTGLWAARAGTDHASSPERHPSDRAAGVTAGGRGGAEAIRQAARRFAGRAVPRRGSNIGSASHAVSCTPGDGDAAPHACSFPRET